MKKIIVGTLSALALCSLAACGSSKQVITIGITTYEPMDYRDENNNWIGFDADLSKKVFTELGYEVKFQVIEWEYKNVDLTTKSIDCIWNGMTITDELKDAFAITDPYLSNFQYGVTKTASKDSYSSLADLNNKTVAVEGGSTANDAIDGYIEEQGSNFKCEVVPCTDQNTAILNVYTGNADIAIVDYTLAKSLLQEGTTYYGSLSPVDLGLEKEDYGVAFRKEDSDLCKKVNDKIKSYYEDGYIATLAEKYGVSSLLISE